MFNFSGEHFADGNQNAINRLLCHSEQLKNKAQKLIVKSKVNVSNSVGCNIWICPVKNKTAIEIFKAFKKIITDSGRKPKKINSDLSLEFKNNLFRKYCHAPTTLSKIILLTFSSFSVE